MEDDEHARQERARRLREEIEIRKAGRVPPGPPRSPNEFVERQMREQEDDEDHLGAERPPNDEEE